MEGRALRRHPLGPWPNRRRLLDHAGMELLLVRHAMPAFGPDVPADLWKLSSDGRHEARALARAIPAGSLLVASREPKARQTLEPAGSVHTDERFNEVVRDEPYDGDYRARRRAYVTGTDHPGWERRDRVVNRFAAGVRFWSDQAAGRPLVIGSHGMAMVLWLTATVGLTDPGAFWTALRLPDLLIVDLIRRQVTPGWSGVADRGPGR